MLTQNRSSKQRSRNLKDGDRANCPKCNKRRVLRCPPKSDIPYCSTCYADVVGTTRIIMPGFKSPRDLRQSTTEHERRLRALEGFR